MEVILTQSIQGVGKAGEAHKVADGYARNYLIPRRMAVAATKGNMRNLDKIRTEAEKREAEHRSAAEKVLAAIDGLRLLIPARVSPDGAKLYGAVTPQDIADVIKTESGQEVDKRGILTQAIKQIGTFPIPVRVYAGLSGNVTVVVYPEGQQPPAEVIVVATEAVQPEPVVEAAPAVVEEVVAEAEPVVVQEAETAAE